jgi:hypothetical protein
MEIRKKPVGFYQEIHDCDAFALLKAIGIIVITLFLCFSSCGSPAIAQEECVVLGSQGNPLPMGMVNYDRTNTEKEINCVVHVLHDNQYFPNSNINLGVIQGAFEQLNVDFDGTNISFNLVHTTYTHLGSFSWADSYRQDGGVCFPNYGTQMAQWTNMVKWNTAEYCNVYVAPDFCSSILGFAWVTYYPWSTLDGVWVETEVFGVAGPQLTWRFENETLTHEMGHYCGLHHVFKNGDGIVSSCGQNIGDCEHTGDYICDTPPTKVSQGCPEEPGYYCPEVTYYGVPFQANNHMDYCPEECRDTFTTGQINRMHAMLEYQRSELFSDETFCFGDFDGDCHVGTSDLLYLLSYYGCQGCTQGDLDLDHNVTSNDLNLLLSVYGDECDCGSLQLPRHPARKPEDIMEVIQKIKQ